MTRATPILLIVLSLTSQGSAEVSLINVPSSPNAVTLQYDPVTGHLRADPGGMTLSSIEISSAGIGPFTGPEVPFCMEGIIFDIHPFPFKLFCLDPDGFEERDYDFRKVMTPGLDADILSADLTVRGSILPPGPVPVSTLYIVPEPSSATIAMLGSLVVLWLRRCWQTQQPG